jgi:hypothetical protein
MDLTGKVAIITGGIGTATDTDPPPLPVASPPAPPSATLAPAWEVLRGETI